MTENGIGPTATANGKLAAGTETPAADLASLVAAEVARQVAGLRADLERAVAELRKRTPDPHVALVVFSGELDRVLAAFVIATGAAAAGLEPSMFFTFWGLSVIKSKTAKAVQKGLEQRLFTLMTPGCSEGLGTSKMNLFGIGAAMLRSMMREQGIASLEELMTMARELGGTLTCVNPNCQGGDGYEKGWTTDDRCPDGAVVPWGDVSGTSPGNFIRRVGARQGDSRSYAESDRQRLGG